VLAVAAAPLAGKLIGKVDPRQLIFGGLMWLAFVTGLRAVATTDMTYWQIAHPLILMGLGLPFFFVPLTALALGSVEEHETASAAGLQNFLRTLSGAVATSIVNTSWENDTSVKHAELVGLVDRDGTTTNALIASGMSPDAANSTVDNLLQGQAVMLATNHLMSMVVIAFVAAALIIWLAPKPARAVDMTQAGH
jgi:MFS transporter, DHA2 family, multidrug resistance protein